MKASDWAAEHSPPGAPLDLDAAFDLFDEWCTEDAEGRSWIMRKAHPERYRRDPLLIRLDAELRERRRAMHAEDDPILINLLDHA